MKIAYLTNQYPKISHTFIRREILALEQLGFEIVRFSIRGAPEQLTDLSDLQEAEKTRIILDGNQLNLAAAVAKMAQRNPDGLRRAGQLALAHAGTSATSAAKQAAYLAEACVLVNWCDQEKISHVHVHFGTNPTTVAMLAQELGGPTFSFTVHGPEEFDKAPVIYLAEKIKRAKFVVAISHYGRSQLMRLCPQDAWNKIHVVRCGVDEEYLGANRSVGPQVDGLSTNRLICVGRLSEQKGQLVLIDAAAAVRRAGYKFELLLVGDGEMRAEVEARIQGHGLSDCVRITGWASGAEVREWLESARAMVLPSFAEGLPVVIMEALALGRPVLSSYVAGIPELVVPGKSGWLVPAGSVEHLSQTIKDVLDCSKQELSRLGESGRLLVQEHHDVKKNAARLAAILRG